MSLFVRSKVETTREEGSGGGNRAREDAEGWDRCDRSSDFALLEAQFRLLRPNAERTSSFFLLVVLISVLSPITRGLSTLPLLSSFAFALSAYPPAQRPQFPPILFSKQVCKTQFSRRLTSHLIARRGTTVSSSLPFRIYHTQTPHSSLFSLHTTCRFSRVSK